MKFEQVMHVLPLFSTSICNRWHSIVTASDSSPYGYGVCYRRDIDANVIASVGSACVKWRYQFEDSIKARAHFFKHVAKYESPHVEGEFVPGTSELGPTSSVPSGAPGLEPKGNVSSGPLLSEALTFDEVPLDILEKKKWIVAWSAPWKYQANILNTEAKALVWSFKHQLRSKHGFSKRILALVDNLPLCLAANTGRGQSSFS